MMVINLSASSMVINTSSSDAFDKSTDGFILASRS